MRKALLESSFDHAEALDSLPLRMLADQLGDKLLLPK